MRHNAHRCRRFWSKGIPCPARKLKGHKEDDREQAEKANEKANELSDSGDNSIPDFIAIGDKRREVRKPRSDFNKPLTLPIPFPQKKELERAAIIQEKGGYRFLPNLKAFLSEPKAQTIMTVGFLLLMLEGLRQSGSSPFATPGRLVAQLETRSASQLSRQIRTGGSPGQGGSGRGRGGFIKNAASELQQLLGTSGRRKLSPRRRKEGLPDSQNLYDTSGWGDPPDGYEWI